MAEERATSLDTFYDRLVTSDDWDDVTNVYETSRRLDLIFSRLFPEGSLDDALFLDAGSGGGHFSASAAERGARVVSIDMGLSLLACVARRCRSQRSVASTLSLPFPSRTFDAVLSTEVIEHTPDPIAALRELARVVAPGGCLVVTTPGKLWQPVVRAASALRLRPYHGRENFVWPHRAGSVLAGEGLEVEMLDGFNLLPLFSRRFDALNRRLDAVARRWPSLAVNFAVRARRPS